mgnify:CR=1 FL=1
MAQDSNRLIWIDMEMSGLVPERDRIIEIATRKWPEVARTSGR